MTTDAIQIGWRRGRLKRRLVALVCLILGSGVVALHKGGGPGQEVTFGIAALLFGCFAVGVARKVWASNEPALRLSGEGFSSARTRGLVPWTSLERFSTMGSGSRALFVINLKPEAAFAIRPTILQRLKLANASRIVFDRTMLDVDVQRLVSAFEERVGDGHGTASRVDPESMRLHALTSRQPFFAYGLIGVLAAILLMEWALRLRPSTTLMQIDPLTLWGLGAVQSVAIVQHGQIWRLVTAALLHGGLFHLLGNAVALGFAASLLERLIGWRWFAAIFAISALSGTAMSIALNPPTIVGVGASGGIVGLAAATAIIAFHFPAGFRDRMLIGGLRIIIPALLPFISGHRTAGGMIIDVAAHLGGAVGGALVAVLLLATWRTGDAQPRFKQVAAGIAGAFFLAATVSLVPISGTYSEAKAKSALAPGFPRDFKQAIGRSSTLISAYPRDPRVRAAHAELLVGREDIAGAEADLEMAIRDRPMLVDGVTSMEPYLRVRLAQLLMSEDKRDDASRILAPACGTTSTSLKHAIKDLGLCP